MTLDIDRMLAALRDRPSASALGELEPRVWGRLEAESRATRAGAPLRWQAGVAALMLTFGVFAGGAAAARNSDFSPFAVRAAYAPSTLLEGGR